MQHGVAGAAGKGAHDDHSAGRHLCEHHSHGSLFEHHLDVPVVVVWLVGEGGVSEYTSVGEMTDMYIYIYVLAVFFRLRLGHESSVGAQVPVNEHVCSGG